MAIEKRTGIPVTLLRHYRTVLSRKTDPRGKVTWIAEVPDMPWCRSTGSSRIEALDRVREMGERRREDGRIGRRLPAKGKEPGEPAPSGAGLPWMRPLEGRDADRLRRGAGAR